MAVVFAGCIVVAGDPVLVVSTAAIDQDRLVPVETIGGAADGNVVS
jgi:hypothetical protein